MGCDRWSSAIDGRTTRFPGYRVSLTAPLLVEKVFGWLKTYGGMRRPRFKVRRHTETSAPISLATYNLLRLSNLTRV